MLNEGKTIAEVARSACLTETSWHRWKNTYGGMKANDAERLKELEAENRRLKLMVADLTLDKAMLKEEGFRKTFNPQIAGAALSSCCASGSQVLRTKSLQAHRSTKIYSEAGSKATCKCRCRYHRDLT